MLYPYYKKDVEDGTITKQDAFELICCLWLKLYRDYDVQQSTVGGCDEEGNSAVNELSYLMLDAVEVLDFIRCISVRYSHKTEKEFIRRALEVVGHVQKGVPFFFNDDVLVKALSDNGIEERNARDYAAIGCVEIVIPGKSNPHAVTGQCNLLKAVEYTLANGYSMLRPELKCGPRTGEPQELDTYKKFKDAVKVHMKHIVDTTCALVNYNIPLAAHTSPLPYKSLLTQGCIEKGLDFNAGGPTYNYYQIMLMGIPNLVDSLIAVKTMVYDKNRCTMEELISQLKNNFPDEAFRLELLNGCPKYGNDITEVNELAGELFAYACDCVHSNKSLIGQGFHAQPFTFLWMFGHGGNTAATPDGRKSGEVFAYSMSPMQGRDFNGFTALLNSIAGLPTDKAPGTTSAIIETDPYLFTEMNIDRLTDIFLAASERGLSNVQFNIIDRKTLLDAQKHPEKHQNLAVRVSGFSQRFVLLDQAIQDHIIARTKHSSF
ncbi:MAG: pyruvate formate lyase family protein [Eubacteriales bacterium]